MSIQAIILFKMIVLLGFTWANPHEMADDVHCPQGWQRIHRGCYMFVVDVELDWNDARDHCKQNSGELTIIQSSREKDELEKYFQTNNSVKKFWIGLKRIENGDDWKWLDDFPLEAKSIPWSNPALKTRKGNMCGLVDITTNKIMVGSSSCTSEQSFICEYHKIEPRNSSDPATTIKASEIFAKSSTIDTTISIVTTTSAPASTKKVKMTVQTSQTAIKTTQFTTAHTSTKIAIATDMPVTNDNKNVAAIKTTAKSDVTESAMTTSTESSPTTKMMSTTTTTTITTTSPKTTVTTTNPTTTTTTTKSTSQLLTSASTTSRPLTPITPRPTSVDWVKEFEKYQNCYIPGTGGSLQDTVVNARSFYNDSRTTCPEVQIGSNLWSAVKAGETAISSCARGNGFATFHCGEERTCWIGQPDVTDCASKKLQAILIKTVHVPDQTVTAPPPTIEESIELSSQLAQVTESEDTTMEDVLVTSRVLTALTQVTEEGPVRNIEQVQAIVDNVVKAGSNLVSTNKTEMWQEMSQDDKVRTASTLLIAMETASVSIAQEINKPALITQKTDNLELELRVVDVSVLEKEKKNEIVYDSSESKSSFSIPMETLQSVTRGGLAKAVFMTHYSMSGILGGRSKSSRSAETPSKDDLPTYGVIKNETEKVTTDEVEHAKEEVEEETGPRIASYILSASLGVEGPITKLPKPISFTIRHVEDVEANHKVLCSFWDVSQNIHQGFWSQDGCRLVRTNRTHTTCECDHMTNFAILLDVHGFETTKTHQSLLRLVTIIGCIISCVSLLASWITFQCFTSLQGERNSIHKNLAMTLLLAEILFVFGIDQARHQILCSVIAGFLHFLFLAAFMWMFVEGLHIIFMLVQVFDSTRSRLPYYYLTAYGVPFVIVGASCLFFYRGYGTDKFCWLTTERYFVWAFAGPVAMILLINAFFLTYAMSTVCRHAEYVFSGKDKTTGGGIRAWVQGALALEVLLGLTWTLGYFILNDDSLILAYTFSVLNSLQGFFIFFFHCIMNKKAQKEYRQVVRSMVKRSPSSATTHTHSTLTKRTTHTNHSNHSNHSHDLNHSPSNSHQRLNVHSGHGMA